MAFEDAPAFPLCPCQCVCYGMEGECACPPLERALRTIAYTSKAEPMTAEQREWCKREIASIEGYTEADGEGDDKQVAANVLNAWRDYCRDKGLM